MTRLANFLENSRIADLQSRIERGERVDLGRTLTLQALDVARLGELYALDVLDAERDADAELERLDGN